MTINRSTASRAVAAASFVLIALGAVRAEAGLYAYAQQEVSNFNFTGASIDTLQTLTTTSAVSSGIPSGNQGFVDTTNAAQAYVGPGPAPAEDTFTQTGLVNPDYVRGDVAITPGFDINNVAEGYLATTGLSAGVGAWTVSGEITLSATGTVTLSFDYSNLLQVIFQNGFPPVGQTSASYAFNFTIATLGPNGAVLFESAPTAVNSSISLTSPGSITSPGSGSISITSTALAAGTYQATITGSERVFLSASSVPEPPTVGGLAAGLVAAVGYALRHRRRAAV